MFRPGVFRLGVTEWDQPPCDDAEMSIGELRAAVERVLGAGIPMSAPADGSPTVARRITGVNSRQAQYYRDRRVLLLGDAAHVHSGVGGPGLNLGLQDALNLGWKLAAEVNGWAPPGLLDTYHDERHPVGERVLMHSRAQMALLAPRAETTALRAVLAELLQDGPAVQRISDLMSGAEVRYSPASDGRCHPLAGRWLPDLPLTTSAGPTRVAELLRTARPVLLDLAARSDLVTAADGWRDRVDVVSATTAVPPADAVLVRPDGFVAWAAARGETGTGGFQEALARWFGAELVVAGQARSSSTTGSNASW
jgi:hypothetical protein